MGLLDLTMCDLLKSGSPSVEVDLDAIFIQLGNVWTSAGVHQQASLNIVNAQQNP
ncbi:UNVERIFIED_ORG: hypothetical protein J2Y77_001614 [Pseudomonas lini]|uniref:Uncharacterized protein n=1 Tax=Pseudomonas viciae TaxID=2505979 RepID=A0ABY8PMD5_9PSED|nr:hypothetical protein [Pseudomonas viciae]UZE89493.1 hypothetical protein LOY66_13850 [Pseudomonas viciae]WGO96394.1 hypothetical protein QCD61_12795 [Pseudomonas viciae]